MENLDWVPVIGAIVAAFIGAAVGGFLRHKWVEKYRRPVISVVGQDFVPVGAYRYHRIRVKNTGKSAAKNCIGKITLENATRNDVAQSSPDKVARAIMNKDIFTDIREMSICWSRIGNPEHITINRDDTQTLDVYRVWLDSSYSVLELPTEEDWNPYRVSLKASKEYSGEIFVTSENAQTERVKFRLVPDPKNGDVKLTILN